jgi:HEAT repeat protein
MKINDSRILRITGISVLILTSLVFYFNWSWTAGGSGEASTDKRGARVRIPSEKGGRPPHASRSERDKVSSNQKPLILPLSRNPNPTTEQCLEALTSSPLEADRVRAAILLGKRAKEKGLAAKAVPSLINALDNDEAPQVWLVCAQALGKYGSDAAEAVPTLLKWFDHATMRDVSIDALADIGSSAEPTIALISPIALDPQERFISRRKAIEAIVRIGGSGHARVAEVLTSAAADADPQIRLVAQQPLKAYHTEIATPGVSPKPDQ